MTRKYEAFVSNDFIQREELGEILKTIHKNDVINGLNVDGYFLSTLQKSPLSLPIHLNFGHGLYKEDLKLKYNTLDNYLSIYGKYLSGYNFYIPYNILSYEDYDEIFEDAGLLEQRIKQIPKTHKKRLIVDVISSDTVYDSAIIDFCNTYINAGITEIIFGSSDFVFTPRNGNLSEFLIDTFAFSTKLSVPTGIILNYLDIDIRKYLDKSKFSTIMLDIEDILDIL